MHCCRVGITQCFRALNKLTSNPAKLYHKTKVLNVQNKMVRNLAAFDFDHTIVDDNTDTVVRDLLPADGIPDSVKKLYKKDGWTAYMQGIFELLHVNRIDESAVAEAVAGIPATEGMIDLIKQLSERLNYDVIIISDSNSYLIDVWLQTHGLKDYIRQIFTNPARWKKGVLRVEMYHLQTHCKLSTKNLCKGQILEEFIEKRAADNVSYDRVLYAGDGFNDFCPILRLNERGLACVRDKYKCHEVVTKVEKGEPVPSTGLTYDIRSEVLVWKTGHDILNALETR